jgi:hypothetical protein
MGRPDPVSVTPSSWLSAFAARGPWTGLVWAERERRGPHVDVAGLRALGAHTFDYEPQNGMPVRIGDDRYLVSRTFYGYCYVRPA